MCNPAPWSYHWKHIRVQISCVLINLCLDVSECFPPGLMSGLPPMTFTRLSLRPISWMCTHTWIFSSRFVQLAFVYPPFQRGNGYCQCTCSKSALCWESNGRQVKFTFFPSQWCTSSSNLSHKKNCYQILHWAEEPTSWRDHPWQ